MRFTKIFGLVAILCNSVAVGAQNFTNIDLQLAAYLEQNNLTDFNVTANRTRDFDDIKITSLGCTIAVSSVLGLSQCERLIAKQD